MTRLLETATFRPDRMIAATRGDFSTATDLADYLVRQVPRLRAAARMRKRAPLNGHGAAPSGMSG
jgi:argininosuccinate lyase